MEEMMIHGTPTRGRVVRRFVGYTVEDRKKIHKWMDTVQPRGFTGMVPKDVTPKLQAMVGIYKYEVVDDEE